MPAPTGAVRRVGQAGLAGLVAGLALGGCSDDEASGDDVVAGTASTEVAGEVARVVVPTGTLSVVVGDPLDGAVPAGRAEDGEDHAATDGRSWVPVSWSFDPLAAFPGQAVVSQQPQRTDVALQDADGDAVELPAPYTVDGAAIGDSATSVFYVATSDPTTLRLDVTYDGLTQRLDVATGEVEAGAAAPLYTEATGAQGLDCGDGQRVRSGGARARIDCDLAVERVPYLPGTGWAADGRSYAVLGWSFSATAPAGSPAVTGTTTVASVDGEPAVGQVTGSFGTTDAEDAAQSLQAFDAPASGGQAVLDVTVRTESGGPIQHEVSVELP
jgi:hypothetical protein